MRDIFAGVFRLVFSTAWVGALITGLLSVSAASDEEDAIEKENTFSRQQARWANDIALKQYEREQRMVESQQKWDQNQDKIKEYQAMINQSEQMKQRLPSIWG